MQPKVTFGLLAFCIVCGIAAAAALVVKPLLAGRPIEEKPQVKKTPMKEPPAQPAPAEPNKPIASSPQKPVAQDRPRAGAKPEEVEDTSAPLRKRVRFEEEVEEEPLPPKAGNRSRPAGIEDPPKLTGPRPAAEAGEKTIPLPIPGRGPGRGIPLRPELPPDLLGGDPKAATPSGNAPPSPPAPPPPPGAAPRTPQSPAPVPPIVTPPSAGEKEPSKKP